MFSTSSKAAQEKNGYYSNNSSLRDCSVSTSHTIYVTQDSLQAKETSCDCLEPKGDLLEGYWWEACGLKEIFWKDASRGSRSKKIFIGRRLRSYKRFIGRMIVKYRRSRLGAGDANHQVQPPTGQKAIKNPKLLPLLSWASIKLSPTVTCSRCNGMPVGCPSEYWEHLPLNLPELEDRLGFSAETIHPREDRTFHLVRNIRFQSGNGYISIILFLLATCLWHEWRDEVSKLGPVYYQRNSHCWKALLERRFQFNGRWSQRSLRTNLLCRETAFPGSSPAITASRCPCDRWQRYIFRQLL